MKHAANNDRRYNTPGRCPRCNHRIGYEPQAGSMPPSLHCVACGWRDFDMKGMKTTAGALAGA